MRAGFIGMGHLGAAMARRLADQGVELTVWNRTPEKAQQAGFLAAASPADLIASQPVVFINVTDSRAVAQILSGEQGLLQGRCAGKIIVDTSTNHFRDVIGFHEQVQTKGAFYLEAPVFGSVVPALSGNLICLVSGKREAYDQARPYLERIAAKIFYLETPSLATRMKLVNNMVMGALLAALSEALVLGQASGLSKEQVLEILAAGSGNSTVLNAKKEKLTSENYSPHFSVNMMIKDLAYLEDLAQSLSRPAFSGSMAREVFSLALPKGLGDADFAAVYKALKEL